MMEENHEALLGEQRSMDSEIQRSVDPDKWKLEEVKMKQKYAKSQDEIAELATNAPKSDDSKDEIPPCEWWDSPILENDLNTIKNDKISVREHIITNMIENPIQAQPPNESTRPVLIPVFLTKKEQKKLPSQNRRAAWLERQEKIRLGLIPPPAPKLKISNMVRVLGTDAVLDPTKIEAQLQEQVAKRQQAYNEEVRDLIRAFKQDAATALFVCVYKILFLHHIPPEMFNFVEKAQSLQMTGVVAVLHNSAIVVVEGGAMQQAKFSQLMEKDSLKWEYVTQRNGLDFFESQNVPNTSLLMYEKKIRDSNVGECRKFVGVQVKKFRHREELIKFFKGYEEGVNYWEAAMKDAEFIQ